jgi:hypothetical protein
MGVSECLGLEAVGPNLQKEIEYIESFTGDDLKEEKMERRVILCVVVRVFSIALICCQEHRLCVTANLVIME